MLYNLKDLSEVAVKNDFSVPAFNISSFEMLKGVMDVVDKTDSPVILEIHPLEIGYLGDEFVSTVREYAMRAKQPVDIHLDHGAEMSDVIRAIRNGYTSVMIDASKKPFEENIRITKEVVAIAHSVGVSVEAELGKMGNAVDCKTDDTRSFFTDPAEAVEFVNATDVDVLAVSIGTAHGLYPKGFVPKLDIELLETIHSKVSIPLVIHGGSGNPDSEISEATHHGVGKINISSDIKSAFFKSLSKTLADNPAQYEPFQIYPQAVEDMKKVVIHKLTIMNAIGKANLYR